MSDTLSKTRHRHDAQRKLSTSFSRKTRSLRLAFDRLEAKVLLTFSVDSIASSITTYIDTFDHAKTLNSTSNPSVLTDQYQENDADGSADVSEAYQVESNSLAVDEKTKLTETPSVNLEPPYLFASGDAVVNGVFELSVPSVVTIAGTADYSGGYHYGDFSVDIGYFSANTPDNSYTHLDFGQSTILGGGRYTFIVRDSGTSDYQSSNGSTFETGPVSLDLNVLVSVSQVQTTTSLISRQNPSTIQQPVTFIANVAPAIMGAPVPTGYVTFYDGLTPIGMSLLNANGNAVLTTSLLTAGTHVITAAYNGNSTDAASSSNALNQVVNDDPYLVPFGQFTFNSEIAKSPKAPNFSLKISAGTGDKAGVTIGAGYDIGSKKPDQIIDDLEAAGVPDSQAEAISEGHGLIGDAAREFVDENKNSIGQITPEEQKQLFIIDYPRYVSSVMETFNDEYSDIGGNSPNSWDKLNPSVQVVLIDIAYQNGMNSMFVAGAADSAIEDGKSGLINYITSTTRLSNEEQTKGPRQRVNYLEANP